MAFRAEEVIHGDTAYIEGTSKIKQVRHFKILVNRIRQDIDIIQSTSDAVTAITAYHSTIVMNYMTYNKLIIGYPAYTLQGYGVITVAEDDLNLINNHALSKYEERGFVLQTNTNGFPSVDYHKAAVILLTETAVCSEEELAFWTRLGKEKGFIEEDNKAAM